MNLFKTIQLTLARITPFLKKGIVICALFSFHILAYGHATQVGWCISPDGENIRIYVEHWHGNQNSPNAGSTLDLAVKINGGAAMLFPSAPESGFFNNTTKGFLPCFNTFAVVSTCTGRGGTPRCGTDDCDDWVYFDTPLPAGICPSGATVEITVNNPSDQLYNDCGSLYPAVVTTVINPSVCPTPPTLPTISDPCSCTDAMNQKDAAGNITRFHDVLTITGTAGHSVILKTGAASFSDATGTQIADGTDIGPIPASGILNYDFYHDSGVTGPIILTINGVDTAPFVINACDAATCVVPVEPIPTMSEWGLFIFGLLVLNLGVFSIRQGRLNTNDKVSL